MEVKIGREYKSIDSSFQYKVLDVELDRVSVIDTDRDLHYLAVSCCENDTLLPPSIEYLQGINQPFGTLDEDVQEALRDRIDNLEYWWIEWNRLITGNCNYYSAYRLSPDYVEKPEVEENKMEVKIGDKIRDTCDRENEYRTVIGIGKVYYCEDNGFKSFVCCDRVRPYKEPTRRFKETKVRVYNDELSEQVQEALFKLGCKFNGGEHRYPGVYANYVTINRENLISTTNDDDRFVKFDYKEVQAHEILEEASKL